MRLRVRSALLSAVLLACAPRYETRPLRPQDCPPDPPPPPVQAAPAAPGVITGQVALVESGEPLEGAQVVIPALRRGATTDASGAFRIDSLPPGTYDLVVRRIGAQRRDLPGVAVSRLEGRELTVLLKAAVMDGCPGFTVRVVRKPWWKW